MKTQLALHLPQTVLPRSSDPPNALKSIRVKHSIYLREHRSHEAIRDRNWARGEIRGLIQKLALLFVAPRKHVSFVHAEIIVLLFVYERFLESFCGHVSITNGRRKPSKPEPRSVYYVKAVCAAGEQ